jgi:hypothetical protein
LNNRLSFVSVMIALANIHRHAALKDSRYCIKPSQVWSGWPGRLPAPGESIVKKICRL